MMGEETPWSLPPEQNTPNKSKMETISQRAKNNQHTLNKLQKRSVNAKAGFEAIIQIITLLLGSKMQRDANWLEVEKKSNDPKKNITEMLFHSFNYFSSFTALLL